MKLEINNIILFFQNNILLKIQEEFPVTPEKKSTRYETLNNALFVSYKQKMTKIE